MLALLGFDQRNALKNIAVPTLVLSGSRDKNAPAPMMAKMATYIPSASYVELEGAGHLVNLERPSRLQCRAGFLSESPCGCNPSDGIMTVQASKSVTAVDAINLDAPIFDPAAFRLGNEQAGIIARARELGQSVFAGRAAGLRSRGEIPDRELPGSASLGPARHRHSQAAWRLRRGLSDLCAGRRRDRPLLRRHRADLEHACLFDAVVRAAGRRSRHGCRHPRRARAPARGALQAHRRQWRDLFAAVLGRRRGCGRRRRLRHRGKAGQAAAGSSTARRFLLRLRDMPIITACSAPRSWRAKKPPGATRFTLRYRPRRTASPWSATGIRWVCAARYRARCCSRTCSCRRMRR